jgi:hypothetical protein
MSREIAAFVLVSIFMMSVSSRMLSWTSVRFQDVPGKGKVPLSGLPG